MLKSLAELLDEARRSVGEVTPRELKAEMEAGKRGVLVDVREPQEWEQGILPGAMPVPRGLLELQLPRFVPDPEAPIVVYCQGGVRSLLAAESLQRMGYTNVRSMSGGFAEWLRGCGFPVERAE